MSSSTEPALESDPPRRKRPDVFKSGVLEPANGPAVMGRPSQRCQPKGRLLERAKEGSQAMMDPIGGICIVILEMSSPISVISSPISVMSSPISVMSALCSRVTFLSSLSILDMKYSVLP